MAGHDAPTRRDVLAVIAPGAALLMAGIPEAGTDIVIVNGWVLSPADLKSAPVS